MNRETIKEYLAHPLFLSFIIWIIIVSFTPSLFNKYRIKLVSDDYVSPKVWYRFADLDSDLENEEISVDLNDLKQTKVIVARNRKVLNEYDIPGQAASNFLPFVGDYNSDGFKELCFLTLTQDSIFLNIIDPLRSHKIILRNRFIDFRYSDRNSIDAPVFTYSGLVPNKESGNSDLVFFIQAGFSKKPRSVYRFVIDRDSLFKSPPGTAVITDCIPCDINNDSLPELILSTSATGNYDDSAPYTDKYTWLMVLDWQLKFLFPPVKLSGSPSLLNVMPYIQDKKIMLLSFQNYSGSEKISSCFYLHDINGNKILERPVGNNENGVSFVIPAGDTVKGEFYFLRNGKTEVDVYEKDLHLARSFNLPEVAEGVPAFSLDADNDGKHEYIFIGSGRRSLMITRHNLKDPVLYHFPEIFGVPIISVFPGQGKNPGISLQFESRLIILEYSRNPFNYFKYPFYGLIYLLAFLFISLLYYSQKYRMNIKKEAERRIASLQIRAIKNQLDPHFTFNMLNNIASLYATDDDKEKLEYIFSKYSQLMRQTVTGSAKIMISLQEELDFVRNYLELETFRASDSFTYTIDIDERTDLEIRIPRMLIHTFIENAINHGLRMITTPGLLRIKIFPETICCKIIIEDNGPGLASSVKSSKSTGRGLIILDEMIELYYKLEKRKISYTLEDIDKNGDTGKGARATILIFT